MADCQVSTPGVGISAERGLFVVAYTSVIEDLMVEARTRLHRRKCRRQMSAIGIHPRASPLATPLSPGDAGANGRRALSHVTTPLHRDADQYDPDPERHSACSDWRRDIRSVPRAMPRVRVLRRVTPSSKCHLAVVSPSNILSFFLHCLTQFTSLFFFARFSVLKYNVPHPYFN